MQRSPQTHQKTLGVLASAVIWGYLGLSGVGLSAKWLRGLDLNQRPLGYEPNELPGCSTPLFDSNNRCVDGQTGRHAGPCGGCLAAFPKIRMIFRTGKL